MMDVNELVDRSAERALQHAATLERHLRSARSGDPSELEACRGEMHELVGDIATLRNATLLLRRQVHGETGSAEVEPPALRVSTGAPQA